MPGSIGGGVMSAYQQWADQVSDRGGRTRDDHPDVSVNWPKSVPSFTMETYTVVPEGGTLCHDAYEVLPDGEPTVVLYLAGVRIRGPLAELQLLLAATGEVLGDARSYAERLKTEQSARAFTDLVTRTEGDDDA